MKQIIAIIFTFSSCAYSMAQDTTKAKSISFVDTARTIKDERIGKIFEKGKERLVSPGAFNKMMMADFSKVQTGARMENVAGSYATLALDKDKQTFSLSRRFITPAGRHRFAVTAAGELNGNGIFDFADRKKVKIGLSYTHLRTFGNYNNIKNKATYEKLYQIVIREFNEEIIKGSLGGMPFDTTSTKDIESAVKKLNDKLDDREIAYFEEKWVSKSFWWVTVNLNPLNIDNFRYIVESDAVSYENPYHKSINVPELSLSFNYYRESKDWIFNPSFGVSGSYKHNLSEIYSTKQWNKVSPLTAQTHLSAETENVYVLPDRNFHQLALLDVELRGLIISKKINLGLEVAISNIKFITPNTSNNVSRINELSMGLVIPLKGADGKRTTNIVPFWSYRQYINHPGEIENNFGIRFNIPFGL